MAKSLPKDIATRIQLVVFKKADEHCYASKGCVKNGRFMDDLVDDPEIGGVIKEYVQSGKVRTYIKDTILNAYTMQKTKQILRSRDPIHIIGNTYGVKEAFVLKQGDIVVCRSSNDEIFVIGTGTVMKWETALRKALEYIARTPGVQVEGRYLFICLKLAVINDYITKGDKTHITSALAAVGVKVYFCSA